MQRRLRGLYAVYPRNWIHCSASTIRQLTVKARQRRSLTHYQKFVTQNAYKYACQSLAQGFVSFGLVACLVWPFQCKCFVVTLYVCFVLVRIVGPCCFWLLIFAPWIVFSLSRRIYFSGSSKKRKNVTKILWACRCSPRSSKKNCCPLQASPVCL